jgi:phosphatidylglycerophosphate synthase
MLNVDLACSIAGFSLVGVACALYGVRVMVRGVAKFDRVAKDKGSALFGASLMQMGYWWLDYLGRGLSALGATANGISLASLVLGIGAGVALAFGHFGVGALLAVLSALGDTLDGIVARLQGTASDGIVVHVRQSAVGVSLVLLALLGSFMVSYATAKAEALRAEVPRGAMRRPERAAYLIIGAGLTPILAPFIASQGGTGWLLELPALGAVGLVALVGNVSAVRRLAKLFAAVGKPRVPVAVPVLATLESPTPMDAPEPMKADVMVDSSVTRAREPEALVPIDATR